MEATLQRFSSDERCLRTICTLVQDHTGIQLSAEKHEMVRSRLARRIRATGTRSLTAYFDLLERGGRSEEMTHVIDCLTTNKTSFFREPRHFDVLFDHLEDTGGGEPATIWCAGCSTGEEPYTLAIHAAERGLSVRILATDISNRALAVAKAGTYDRDTIADVPAALRSRYFAPSGNGYVVRSSLRDVVSFASLNLLAAWPMRGPFDAILCRNVMIYFDRPTREKLVARYHEKLSADGRLFTGLSESLTGLDHAFTLVEPGVYAPG